MSFWVFYLLALIPLVIGGIWFVFDKQINWIEWIVGSVVAFILAGIFHVVSVGGMTDDVETWSGQIVRAKHYAKWQEYYEYAVYRTEYYTTTESYYTTDSKGHRHRHTRTVRKSRQVFDHWEPTSRWHNEHYTSWSNINTSYGIPRETFDHLSKKFADHTPVKGDRKTGEHNSRMIAGDPNDYMAENKTGWVQPITDHRKFENRIKAAPSVFSFQKVPQGAKVYGYPANNDPWRSDRLLGTAAKTVNNLAFDQMNSRLGPTKKVNVILVGMETNDTFNLQWQEAAWLRGRKNDIVISWIGPNEKPTAVKVFSWGEGIALKNIETLVLEKGVSNDILSLIEQELSTGFTRADWKKWNYLTIEINPSYVWWYIGIMIIFQGCYWAFARMNGFDKTGSQSTPSYSRYSRY